MKIRTKLILTFLTISIFIFLTGNVATGIVQKGMVSQIGNDMVALSERSVEDLDREFFGRIEQLRILAHNPDLSKSMKLSNEEFDALPNPNEVIDERDRIWRTFDENERNYLLEEITATNASRELRRFMRLIEQDNHFRVYGEVFITNKYGANVAQSGKTSDYKQSDEEWWTKAKQNKVYIGSVEYDESAEINSIDIAIAIEDDDGNFLGVMKAVLNLREIESFITKLKNSEAGESMEITLIDNNHEVVYSTYLQGNNDSVLLDENFRQRLERDQYFSHETSLFTGNVVSIGGRAVRGDGQEVLVAVASSEGYGDFTGLGWSIVIENDMTELLAPVQDIKRFLDLISWGLILASILIGLYISKTISDPLLHLKDVAGQIGQGNLETRTALTSSDEFGELGASINQMSQNLKGYQEKLLSSEREKGKELEKQVAEKTHALNEKVRDLNRTKAAMLNMMGDLNEANDNLKQLDKTKGEFLNMVSHELKTPLTAIIAHLGVLDDMKENLTQEEIQSFEAIKRNAHNLKILISNILEISRMEAGKFELTKIEVDLGKLIKDSVDNLQILAQQKGLKLETNVGAIPMIVADDTRLHEIINNLVTNALKFTEKGSVTISAVQQEQNIQVSVKDTGIGIPEAKMKNLFHKFYQVDASISRRYGGTGLGLSITKKLVEAHGGQIHVESKEGQGTTFIFTIPIKAVEEKDPVKKATLEEKKKVNDPFSEFDDRIKKLVEENKGKKKDP